MAIERPTFHESWYRVAELHPKLRSTVQISRQHFRGQPWFVVQDHTNNAFFRLAAPAYRFIGLLDGKRTIADAWTLANEQLGDDAPTQGEVIQLLGQLYTSNLLQAEVPADTESLFSRYKKRKQREIASYLMNIMFSRIPILDPDGFLNRWLPLLGWIFAPLGLVVWLFLIGCGVYSIMQYPGWQNEIARQQNGLLGADNLVLLYVAFALIKACHEMGHAISCKKFGKQSGTGGEVHVIGIMFLVFTPVPYVDASSSWALTNKWHRAIVGAAGMWVELAIASVGAMIWANSSQGAVHNFAYNIMFVAGFSTIVFNANPLLRYDGYYILSDLLEIPNLSTRGKDYIYYLVKKYAWNVRHARNPAHGSTEKFWLFLYAIASFVMRIFVTLSIMFYLTGVLNGTLIILAAMMTIAGLVTWFCVPLGKFIHYLWTSPELSRVRFRAIATSFLVIFGLAAFLAFVPMPDHSRAPGVSEPDRGAMLAVNVPDQGITEEWNGEPRMAVNDPIVDRLGMPYVLKDTVLLRARNYQTDKMIADYQSKIRETELAISQAIAADPRELLRLKANLATYKSILANQEKIRDDLTVRAPMTGIFVAPDFDRHRVAYVNRDRIGVVADFHRMAIRAAVPNELGTRIREEIRPGDTVQIRLTGRPDILLTGVVQELPESGTTTLPSPAMGIQGGGSIQTASDDPHGLKTTENFFEVRIGDLKLTDHAPDDIKAMYKNTDDVPLLAGQRVVVRFNLKTRPLIYQAWTKIQQVFQKKFHVG